MTVRRGGPDCTGLHSFQKLNYDFLVKAWVLEQSLQLVELKKDKKLKSPSNGPVPLSLNLLVLI